MISLYLLKKKDNSQLLSLLLEESIKEPFGYLVNDIASLIFNTDKIEDELKTKVSINLIIAINKILLDNIYKRVVNKELSELTRLILNNIFHLDIYVNSKYIHDLYSDSISPYAVDDYLYFSVENEIQKRIVKYISYIYSNRHNIYNEAIINTASSFQETMGWLNNSKFRVEITKDTTPCLFVY